MKKLVSDTSIEAHYSGKVHGWKKRAVIDYAKTHHIFTRSMISDAIGVCTATVSGIVSPMIYDGVKNPNGVLFETLSKMPCPVTGNNVHWLEHKDYAGGQLKLC